MSAEQRASASLTKPKDVLARMQELWFSGHEDRDGIALAIEDNLVQDAKDSLEGECPPTSRL